MRTAHWIVVTAMGMMVGCVPQQTLPTEATETLVVYSLDPLPLLPGDELEAGQVVFHKHIILGSVGVTDPNLTREILDGVQHGIKEGKKVAPWDRTECGFQPRHGLHYISKDGSETDWLICFRCHQMLELKNGELVKRERSFGPDVTVMSSIQDFVNGPQQLLNETLRKAQVKLAD